MTPSLIRKLPRRGQDGEIWNLGGGYELLVLPAHEVAYISAHGPKDRAVCDWMTDEIERVAKEKGFWLETTPSIDIMMVVVRSADVPAFLQACADHFSGSQET